MMELRAHAKINLHLHSTRRRDDGYHELRTVFCHLDLHDKVFIEPLDGHVELLSDTRLSVEQDLAGRAALALRRALGRPELGCRIRVHKAIPAGGGLGGGSADAAAVLRGLTKLWQADEATLFKVASELGADVPFLLSGGLALASGKGEILTPLRTSMAPLSLILLFPGHPVSTPTAFSWMDEDGLDRDEEGPGKLKGLLGALGGSTPGAVIQSAYNAFGACVSRREPRVAAAIQAAKAAGLTPLLCGSGSTVAAFGEGDSEHRALREFNPQRASLAGFAGAISSCETKR
jgi:4-diphosphocytidyl-2-C-methyl-D-erythritol kinase